MRRKYSEIVWLSMGRIASTSTTADALTGLPNTYNATIKKELIYQHVWRDAGEVRTAVFDYIERYYNHVRKQRRLGKISPADYERQFDNWAPKAA